MKIVPSLIPIEPEHFDALVQETGLSRLVVAEVLLGLPCNRRSSRYAVNKARMAQLGLVDVALIGDAGATIGGGSGL